MSVKKKGVFLLRVLFLIILFAVSVEAIPPVLQAQTGDFDIGFFLSYPVINVLTQDEDFLFNFHVFNSSNGLGIIEGVSCDFHLYNNFGDHIFLGFDDDVAEGYDYEFGVTADNFSRLGEYSYIVNCNNSVKGGFVATAFEVTPSGLAPSLEQALFYIVIMFLAIVMLVLFVFFAWNIKGENEYDVGGGFIKVNFNKYLKIGLWFICYQLALLISYLALEVSETFLFMDFGSVIFYVLFWIFLVGELPLFFLVVYSLILKTLLDWRLDKAFKRGVDPR